MAYSAVTMLELVVMLTWAILNPSVRKSAIFSQFFTEQLILADLCVAASLSFCPGLFQAFKPRTHLRSTSSRRSHQTALDDGAYMSSFLRSLSMLLKSTLGLLRTSKVGFQPGGSPTTGPTSTRLRGSWVMHYATVTRSSTKASSSGHKSLPPEACQDSVSCLWPWKPLSRSCSGP